jgi:hypothetical protein
MSIHFYIPFERVSPPQCQIVQFGIGALYIHFSCIYLTSLFVALLAILRCSLFLQPTPDGSRGFMTAFDCFVRSASSEALMAAVKNQVSPPSNSLTERDGLELFRIVMAHPLEFTPHSDVEQRRHV